MHKMVINIVVNEYACTLRRIMICQYLFVNLIKTMKYFWLKYMNMWFQTLQEISIFPL